MVGCSTQLNLHVGLLQLSSNNLCHDNSIYHPGLEKLSYCHLGYTFCQRYLAIMDAGTFENSPPVSPLTLEHISSNLFFATPT